MRASWWKSLLAISIASLLPGSNAVRFLRSQSLDPCSDNPKITASLFDVIYFPDNATVQYDINAYTMITGKVNVQFQVIAYGYQAATIDIDPCDGSLTTNFCPIEATGPIELMSSNQLPDDIVPEIPGRLHTKREAVKEICSLLRRDRIHNPRSGRKSPDLHQISRNWGNTDLC